MSKHRVVIAEEFKDTFEQIEIKRRIRFSTSSTVRLSVEAVPYIVIGDRQDSQAVSLRSEIEIGELTDQIEFTLPMGNFADEQQMIDWARETTNNFAATLPDVIVEAVKAHFVAVAAHAADKHGIIADLDLADAIERLSQNVKRETKLLLGMRRRGRGKDIKTLHKKSEVVSRRDQMQYDEIVGIINELYPPNSGDRPSRKLLAERLGITTRGLSGRLKRLGISDLEELQSRKQEVKKIF